MEVYGDSSFEFYRDSDKEFWCADNQNATPYHIGSLEDVEAFLMGFAGDE